VTQIKRVLDKRRAGILLHPTSLLETPGNGDLGHQAYRFIEFLSASGMTIWQTLPLGPTHDDLSPYQCLSVHAGNPLLISLDWLRDRGWLISEHELRTGIQSPAAARMAALELGYRGFKQRASVEDRQSFTRFVDEHDNWLDDYALYSALRQELKQAAWMDWSVALRDRHTSVLEESRRRLANQIDRIKFEQFVFFRQWQELKGYAHQHGVLLFGDMPIFVAHDSAEVWAHREYFSVDEQGRAEFVAGVPPDYFSETGQRWGNPLYQWEVMHEDGFRWWIQRMQTQVELFDLIRIDHFRGFQAYWEIPANEETAIQGRWVEAPGNALLSALYDAFDGLPLVAEDLGTITTEVDALRKAFKIPGMKVLQFAFGGGSRNPYLVHNHERNSVVYTGTHDNDTTLGWFQALSSETQGYVRDYLGYPEEPMPWPLIRCALASHAQSAIIPLQDILGLGTEHRMNVPGTTQGNWQWRYPQERMTVELELRVLHLVNLYGRI
jgi:4-alpha-glucanotransferase